MVGNLALFRVTGSFNLLKMVLETRLPKAPSCPSQQCIQQETRASTNFLRLCFLEHASPL